MGKGMNDFCEYCTGKDRKLIKECEDRYCPFYEDRWANLDWQNDKKRHN